MRDLSRKQRTAIRVKGESGKPTTNCAIYGYKKDSNDKYHWLIDEEAAAVVRRIFQLTIEGHGPYEIATMLCEEKIETPATYFARQSRGVWKGREDIPRPYSWNGFAVGQILSKPEYMFDRFYQGSPARGEGGAGLGLSIVRELMEQMGGRVSARIDGDILRIMLMFSPGPDSRAIPHEGDAPGGGHIGRYR